MNLTTKISIIINDTLLLELVLTDPTLVEISFIIQLFMQLESLAEEGEHNTSYSVPVW